eukprot:3424658-Pyramimonas_sp.AAC.1
MDVPRSQPASDLYRHALPPLPRPRARRAPRPGPAPRRGELPQQPGPGIFQAPAQITLSSGGSFHSDAHDVASGWGFCIACEGWPALLDFCGPSILSLSMFL